HGQTGLHWAALGGYPDIVRLLLERGAPADLRDPTFDGTALEWALYGWDGQERRQSERFAEVVALLQNAGASLDVDRYESHPEGRERLKHVLADPYLAEVLMPLRE